MHKMLYLVAGVNMRYFVGYAHNLHYMRQVVDSPCFTMTFQICLAFISSYLKQTTKIILKMERSIKPNDLWPSYNFSVWDDCFLLFICDYQEFILDSSVDKCNMYIYYSLIS